MGAEARSAGGGDFGWEVIARQTLDCYEESREARKNGKKSRVC